MKIPVVRMDTTGDKNRDFVEIDLVNDVNFVSKVQKTKNSVAVLAFHTSFGSFFSLTTLHETSISFEKYGFKMMDGSTLVNLSRIMETIPVRNGTKIVFVDHTYETVRTKYI